jgi:lipopolysaccharide transport system permease protein
MTRLLRDVTESARLWRIWAFLAWEDIARQYRRSFLGPVWLTVNFAVLILAFGYIWSEIFKYPIKEYLPYVAAGHIAFSFLNACIIESTTLFSANEAFLKQLPIPKTGFAVRMVMRNLIILAHNLPVLLIALYWFDVTIGADWWLSLVALVIAGFNAILVGASLGALCARYRDVPMIVSNLMQVLFFVTPILWKPEQLGERARLIVDINPLAAFLQILRNPILGLPIPDHVWLFVGATTCLSLALFVFGFGWSRRRLVYWL